MRTLLSLATAITILALALIVLLTPIWTHAAISAAGSTAPGGDPIAANDRTIADLLTFGQFDFATSGGEPLYTADERAHMRDVQLVLYAFLALAAVALAYLVVALRRAPRDAARWSAVSRGAAGLVIGIVVLGIFGLLAFDAAFTLFHEVLFPGGNWAFPADSNLIRLYPEPFWELSAATLGALAAGGGAVTWFVTRRRAQALAG